MTVINFCPTGMVPTKKSTPYVPIHPNEIIEEVHNAYEIGITLVHLHAREEDEMPAYAKSIYQEIFDGVRKHCPDLVICGSSSGRNFPEFEKRSALLELRPDMCSLTLSSLNFLTQASVNAPDMIIRLAEKMEAEGVVPELECFDLGMINYGLYLIRKGILKGPYYWNLLFGNIAGFQADLLSMGTAIAQIPDTHFIALAGLAEYQLPVSSVAISMGYGVRIGIEDNIWWDKSRTRPCTNIELIQRTHQLLEINQMHYLPSAEFGKLGFYNRKKN